MASSINASTSGAGGLITTADNTGILNLQTAGTTAVTIDASQRVAFVAGTAALPAITTTGDTNTGIFFSAADTIDFAEGGTAVGQFDSSANFKFNSGYGSVATAYGCRAWANINGSGSTGVNQTIRASGNVSSVAHPASGVYTVNFTNAMPDANYSYYVSLSGDNGGTISGAVWSPTINQNASTISNPSASSFTFSFDWNISGRPNPLYINIAVFR